VERRWQWEGVELLYRENERCLYAGTIEIKYNNMKCKVVRLGNNIENFSYNYKATEEPEFL